MWGTRIFSAIRLSSIRGETVLEAGDVAGLFSAEIDLDLVAAVRRKIPIFADRRPDVYGS